MTNIGDFPTLADVMEQHPELSSFGIGVFDPRRKTPDERRLELAEDRDRLLDNEDLVLEVAAWLRESIEPIKTPTVSSYTMKHVAEEAIGKYVTNGELIAAALVAGYPVKYTGGANVDLGMSKRDIDAVRQP